jgi:hypothetical protein
MTDFTGTLLITDREALLVQVTAGGMTVQTPLLMQGAAPVSVAMMMAFARSFFVDESGLGTGSPVTVHGTVSHVGQVPVIVITRE